MLGAAFLFGMMLPVGKPVAEVVHRLHVTGLPARESVLLQQLDITNIRAVLKQFFNPSPAVDLVYGMRVVPKLVFQRQIYPVISVELAIFPVQYSWLRSFFQGTVQQLSVVAWTDAPTGNTLAISKGGVTYAVYLVDTIDVNASPIRLTTTTGTKAIRLKT